MNFHDFNDCLKASHEAEDHPMWNQIYRRSFPDMVAMVSYREYGEHQRAGIDRGIYLANSKEILIDEKVRSTAYMTNGQYDIALEHISVDTKNIPGWVCKPLRADYIAYAIKSVGMCFLLPVLQLQQAWFRNGGEWRKVYGDRIAKNKDYNTWFTPVPVNVLYAAIGQCLRVNFDPVVADVPASFFTHDDKGRRIV